MSIPESYADPGTAYLALLGLAWVLAEFTLPDAWPWYRRRVTWLAPIIYAGPVVLAPSLERTVGLAALALAITLWRLTFDAHPDPAGGAGSGTREKETPGGGGFIFGRFLSAAVKALLVLAFGLATARAGPPLPDPFPGQAGPLARVVTWTAVYLFMFGGATTVVRWVLDAALPAAAAVSTPGRREAGPAPLAFRGPGESHEAEVAATGEGPGPDGLEPPTLRLGRLIGNIERLIIITLVVLEQYTAIGVVMAAKSVVRYERVSRSPAFAEYYLVGTLMSIAIALGGGLLLTLLDRALL